jgi:hypothetical protein
LTAGGGGSKSEVRKERIRSKNEKLKKEKSEAENNSKASKVDESY